MRLMSVITKNGARNAFTILAEKLVDEVRQGLEVFVIRDGVPLTPDQILERSKNVVAGILGNYVVTPRGVDHDDGPSFCPCVDPSCVDAHG